MPVSQARNEGSSANNQKITVSMDNIHPGVNEDQSVTSPCGEALGGNFDMRRSKRIRNSPQRYNPGFGAAREWNNDAVASIFYKNPYLGSYILYLQQRHSYTL